jgi:hypothetical protein
MLYSILDFRTNEKSITIIFIKESPIPNIMITKFNLEGFYNYVIAPNGRGNLTGELEVAEDGSFEGVISDHASLAPEQTLRGHLRKEGGLDHLLFLKFPLRANFANLAYALNKESNGSFDGKYSGQWGALPFKVEFNREYGLFVTQIDMSMCSIGDSAEINLYKK